MGLFGSRKKTHVSSVVYNLAGDIKDRPNFMKTTVLGSVLHNSPSISKSITDSYLNGPGMRFRSFAKWARTSGYTDAIGLVTGSIQTGDSLDSSVVLAQLPQPAGTTLVLQAARIEQADFSYWADRYALENYPERLHTQYTSDYNGNEITIQWEDGSTDAFSPEGYDPAGTYLYAMYRENTEGTDEEDPTSVLKIFIYQRGTGNAELDALFAPNTAAGQFFPFIPFRVDNEFLSESNLPSLYEQAKKGYRRATNSRYKEIVDALEENEDLEHIDYAYVVFGVSLNTREDTAKKYIYRFFQEILNDTSTGDPEEWEVAWQIADASQQEWGAWKNGQNDPESPYYGTPEPERLPYPAAPSTSIRIASDSNAAMNYDMTISWLSMREEFGAGLARPDAKQDDIWVEVGERDSYTETVWDGEGGVWDALPGFIIARDELVVTWQVTPSTWQRIRVAGLQHKNLIYNGKAVEITAREALDDPEESGFIIPLHEGIYRSLGLKDGTQMATACSYMVLNCYQVVKKKWYQTGIFKAVLVIIVVVVTVYTGGLGATGSGLLGTNAAVGATLGFAGTTAVVVGAVANAVAAMLLMRVITTAATALFGEKWGAIIGAVASIIAVQVGTSMASGQSFASSFSGMMKADNILKLTMAAGDGYAGYLQASAMEIAQETQAVLENYQEEARKIADLWEENIGSNRGIIDPLAVTDAFGVTMESVDSFLQRTLMTGSDVADMSLNLLTNFVDITLSTELPT